MNNLFWKLYCGIFDEFITSFIQKESQTSVRAVRRRHDNGCCIFEAIRVCSVVVCVHLFMLYCFNKWHHAGIIRIQFYDSKHFKEVQYGETLLWRLDYNFQARWVWKHFKRVLHIRCNTNCSVHSGTCIILFECFRWICASAVFIFTEAALPLMASCFCVNCTSLVHTVKTHWPTLQD